MDDLARLHLPRFVLRHQTLLAATPNLRKSAKPLENDVRMCTAGSHVRNAFSRKHAAKFGIACTSCEKAGKITHPQNVRALIFAFEVGADTFFY